MIAHHGMSYNWSPAEDSPERPWARFIMHLGNHMSKVVGPTLTPLLAGRFGWRFVARLYGCSFGGFALLWQAFTSSHPPPPPTTTSAKPVAETEAELAAEPVTSRLPLQPESKPEPEPEPEREPVPMIRLLFTPPQQACLWIQVTHDLIEVRPGKQFCCLALGAPPSDFASNARTVSDTWVLGTPLPS
jgi:hypothetical protein|eukprot:COSAG02_NODE_3546_length_6583_cov_2.799661_9_plen_188_part_00